MTTKRKLFSAVILMIGCFVYSAASGETVKRAISCPQDINEKQVMGKAISEGQKMGYDIKQEERKTILSKRQSPGMIFYRISLAIAPGGDGRKVFTIDGEARGDIGLMGRTLDNDVKQIEKTVKKYLESK